MPIESWLQGMINRRRAGQYGPIPSAGDTKPEPPTGTPTPSARPRGVPGVGGVDEPYFDVIGALGKMFPAPPRGGFTRDQYEGGQSAPAVPPVGFGQQTIPRRPEDLPQLPNYARDFGGGSVPSKPLPGLGENSVVSTKLDPKGSISYGWKGQALQKFDPNTGINPSPELAASRARGFMGRAGNPGGGSYVQGGGELVNGKTDWSKVANPMAFDAYRESPERADIERYTQDPMWREKQTAEIEQAKQIAIAKADAEAKASALERAAAARRIESGKLALEMINTENERRSKAGQPPMTEEEKQAYYHMASERTNDRYTPGV